MASDAAAHKPGYVDECPACLHAKTSMSQNAFSVVAGVFFLLIALCHLLRVVFGVTFVVQDIAVPMWANGLAFIVTGYLAFAAFRLARKSHVQ